MEELPEPHGWLHDANGNDPLTFVLGALPYPLALLCSTIAVYTAGQMIELLKAERERCALIADDFHKRYPAFGHNCVAAAIRAESPACAKSNTSAGG